MFLVVVWDPLEHCGVVEVVIGHLWQLLDMADISTVMSHWEVKFCMHVHGYMYLTASLLGSGHC